MSYRSWVDDCPSGILTDCFLEKKKNKVLSETQAAFESYDRMLGQEEGFRNYSQENSVLWLIFLLILIAFLLYYR